MKLYSYAVAVTVAAGITLSGLKPAYGELVFEDDLNAKPAAKAEPASPADARAADQAEMSKAEMMRRQRLRQELKNEDLLTQKLEELRLKDEMKRTDQLVGTESISGVSKPVAPQALEEERVGSAAANPAAGPAQQPQAQMAAAPVTITGAPADASSASGQSVATAAIKDEKEDSGYRVSLTPRFGTASITNSIYNVSAKWAAGFSASMDITDYVAVSGGYTYSTYSLAAGSSVSYPTGFNTSSYLQTLNLNDNFIDLGAKIYLLGPKAKLRPFVGAGAGYRRGYVNYDNSTQNFLKTYYGQSAAQDVEISGFAGYVEAGVEFKLTGAVSLTGSFRYMNMLSSSQSTPLNPNAFVGQGGYGYYGYNGGLSPYYGALGTTGYSNGLGYNNDTRTAAGNALASENFYQLMAGVSISF